MSVIPGKLKLRIPQRASLRLEVTLPFDCTDKEVAAQVWDKARECLLLQLKIEWIDRPNGLLVVKAPWSMTARVKENGYWDLLVVDTISGSRDYYLEGETYLDPGYTELTDA